MFGPEYYASMDMGDINPVDFANSAPSYMGSGFTGDMEAMYAGDGVMGSGMDYMTDMGALGAMGGRPGIPPVKLQQLKENATGATKSGSPLAIAGPYQMPPDRDLSHKADDPNQMGLRGRQGGIVRTGVTPAGLAQAAGPVVKNNYPKLNGLMNRAQGIV